MSIKRAGKTSTQTVLWNFDELREKIERRIHRTEKKHLRSFGDKTHEDTSKKI